MKINGNIKDQIVANMSVVHSILQGGTSTVKSTEDVHFKLAIAA